MKNPDKPWIPVSSFLAGISCKCGHPLVVGDHIILEEAHSSPGMVTEDPEIVGCSACLTKPIDHMTCAHCHQAKDPLVSAGPRKLVRRSSLR